MALSDLNVFEDFTGSGNRVVRVRDQGDELWLVRNEEQLDSLLHDLMYAVGALNQARAHLRGDDEAQRAS